MVDKLQAAFNAATVRVTQELLPKLRELEDLEVHQKATLSNMSADIDGILEDIRNLEVIQKTIPVGCYNSPPIERP